MKVRVLYEKYRQIYAVSDLFIYFEFLVHSLENASNKSTCLDLSTIVGFHIS